MKAIANLLMDRLKIRHFLVIFIISLPLSAFLLRQNNLMAVELRDKVLSVDEEHYGNKIIFRVKVLHNDGKVKIHRFDRDSGHSVP